MSSTPMRGTTRNQTRFVDRRTDRFCPLWPKLQSHCPSGQAASALTDEEMIRIGINGFGRIGRTALRASMDRGDVQVVAVNDLLELPHAAYLLRHDSVHGRFRHTVGVEDRSLVIDG